MFISRVSERQEQTAFLVVIDKGMSKGEVRLRGRNFDAESAEIVIEIGMRSWRSEILIGLTKLPLFPPKRGEHACDDGLRGEACTAEH